MCNKKVHSDELCTKYGKRAGGRQHIFLDAQLFRKWFSKKLCNKKVLKSTLYFIFFIWGGRFQQKELGQHIFFVGGHWLCTIGTLFSRDLFFDIQNTFLRVYFVFIWRNTAYGFIGDFCLDIYGLSAHCIPQICFSTSGTRF